MIQLTVVFRDANNAICRPPLLALVQSVGGKIYYEQYDPDDGYFTVHSEQFDKAEMIVNQELTSSE
jgi:hypothetical protein